MKDRKLTFSEVEIQGLFGNEAAEDEEPQRLREYYLKSSTFDKVITDLPLRILVGHKGIGKSALFQVAIAEEQEKNRLTVLVRPDDVVGLGTDTSDFLKTIRDWKNGLTDIIARKLLSSLRAGDEHDENFLERSKKYGASITASATPVPAVPGKSTAAPAEKDVAGLSQTLNSPDRSVSHYDFFIAYATPDRRLAQSLCWSLQDDACEVFLDEQDLARARYGRLHCERHWKRHALLWCWCRPMPMTPSISRRKSSGQYNLHATSLAHTPSSRSSSKSRRRVL